MHVSVFPIVYERHYHIRLYLRTYYHGNQVKMAQLEESNNELDHVLIPYVLEHKWGGASYSTPLG